MRRRAVNEVLFELTVVVAVASIVFVVVLAVVVTFAGAQGLVAPSPCDQSLACLRERVRDLKDYRDFVDDQLALAKALNHELRVHLAQRDAALTVCREALPPELPPREPRK